MAHRKIVLHVSSLPCLVEIKGDNGERAIYTLTPAGRKFGASLQKIINSSQLQLLRDNDLLPHPRPAET